MPQAGKVTGFVVVPSVRQLGIKAQGYIHSLVFLIDGFVLCDFPRPGRQQIPGLVKKSLRIAGVIGFAGEQFPPSNQASGGAGIETANFQFAHFVDVALVELEQVLDRGLRVVHFGRRLDGGCHVAATAVELLYGFQIAGKLNCVCWLTELLMDQLAKFLYRKCLISRDLDLGCVVLAAWIDRESDVYDGFLRAILHDPGLGLGKGSLEITALQINRQKVLFGLNAEYGAEVVLALQLAGSGLQQGQLGWSRAGEFEVANVNARAGDAEDERLNGAFSASGAEVVGPAPQVALDQQGLQRIRNLVGEAARHRQLAVKE